MGVLASSQSRLMFSKQPRISPSRTQCADALCLRMIVIAWSFVSEVIYRLRQDSLRSPIGYAS